MNIFRLENHFDLQNAFIKTTNHLSWKYEVVKEDAKSLQQRLQKIYPSPKPLVKMKLNKLLAFRRIVLVHARKGRVVRFKSSQC